jgi:hypothetical protein
VLVHLQVVLVLQAHVRVPVLVLMSDVLVRVQVVPPGAGAISKVARTCGWFNRPSSSASAANSSRATRVRSPGGTASGSAAVVVVVAVAVGREGGS